ncbi:MAG: efflux RND transporter periplasmic adaptor subunit [Acidobacteria bacterium]|nr:efflux RND transporter periplasmic adaptor subunit [Acidobacteriota bacterium]
MPMGRLAVTAFVMSVLLAVMARIGSGRHSEMPRDNDIPVSPVKRDELHLNIFTTGELRAQQLITLSAPPVAGGALRITRLLHSGTRVKQGDAVIEFDPGEQNYKLEESRSELLEAEQDIIKARADAAVQNAQDQVALLKARYAVRGAQLEVQKNELISGIEAKKNQLALDEAQRALAELEQDIQSHQTSGQAGLDLAREKWNKTKLSLDLARHNIEQMHVVSPTAGLVAVEKNMDAAREFFFSGASVPDYHEGDQAQPGSPIVRIIVSRQIELAARISEFQRTNVEIGQPVEIQFDALPGRVFQGTIKAAGEMVQRQFWDGDGGSKFDVSIQLQDSDVRLRPGLTAQVTMLGKKINTLYIPRQALFQKDGKQIVYRKKNAGFEQLVIKVEAENESRAAIEGLHEGDEVAMIDPTMPPKAPLRDTSSAGRGSP